MYQYTESSNNEWMNHLAMEWFIRINFNWYLNIELITYAKIDADWLWFGCGKF